MNTWKRCYMFPILIISRFVNSSCYQWLQTVYSFYWYCEWKLRECFIEKRTIQWIKFSVSQEKMFHLSSLRKCFPLKSGLLSKTFATQTGRKKLVILGTGWGGYSLLRNIDKKLFDVVVISPRNYFLFTPMLASTTVGTVEFRYWLNFLAKYSTHFRCLICNNCYIFIMYVSMIFINHYDYNIYILLLV